MKPNVIGFGGRCFLLGKDGFYTCSTIPGLRFRDQEEIERYMLHGITPVQQSTTPNS